MYAKITCVRLCLCILPSKPHTSNQTHSHAKSPYKRLQYKLTQTHTHIRVHSYPCALPPPLSLTISHTPVCCIYSSFSFSQQVQVEDAFPPMELTCSKISSPTVFLCFPFLFKSCELFRIVYQFIILIRLAGALNRSIIFEKVPMCGLLNLSHCLSLTFSSLVHTYSHNHARSHTRTLTHAHRKSLFTSCPSLLSLGSFSRYSNKTTT